MTSRERILSAAIPIFARKGRHGAHMEEIASLAHINKAMIYYIFHSKDELYFEVLKFVMEKAWESFAPFADSEVKMNKGYADVLSDYITTQLNFFYENRNYTKILVDAMSSGAEEIPRAEKFIKASHIDRNPTASMKEFIEKGKESGVIRDIDTDHLMISIMGMIIVYFLTHSISESFNIEMENEPEFMEARRKSIIDLVLNGILVRK